MQKNTKLFQGLFQAVSFEGFRVSEFVAYVVEYVLQHSDIFNNIKIEPSYYVKIGTHGNTTPNMFIIFLKGFFGTIINWMHIM